MISLRRVSVQIGDESVEHHVVKLNKTVESPLGSILAKAFDDF